MTKASKTTRPGRLTKALLETAGDMRQGGLLDESAHDKITMRLIGEKAPSPTAPCRGIGDLLT